MAVCVALTLPAIWLSYHARGYIAIGGEYLIIPIGMILSCFVVMIADELSWYKTSRNKEAKHG